MISGSDSRKHAQSRLGVKVRLPASRRPVARGQCAAAESGSELIEQKIPLLVSWLFHVVRATWPISFGHT